MRMQAMEIGRFKLVPVVRAHVSPEDVSVNCVSLGWVGICFSPLKDGHILTSGGI